MKYANPVIADLLRASGSLLMTYGKELLDLIIYHWAGENLPSASCGQADEFHQNAERVARDTLADELELGRWVLLGRGEALAIKDGKLPARLLRGSVESLLGVAGLFCSYGRLYQRVDSCVQQAPARQGDVSISHKSLLQEVSQGLGRGRRVTKISWSLGPFT